MSEISRRKFIVSATALAGVVGSGLSTVAVANEGIVADIDSPTFNGYPIPTAPPANHLEITQMVVPDGNQEYCRFSWEFAADEYFEKVVNADEILITGDEPEAITVSLLNVPPGKQLYVRFNTENCYSEDVPENSAIAVTRRYDVLPQKQMRKDLFASQNSSPTLQKTF